VDDQSLTIVKKIVEGQNSELLNQVILQVKRVLICFDLWIFPPLNTTMSCGQMKNSFATLNSIKYVLLKKKSKLA